MSTAAITVLSVVVFALAIINAVVARRNLRIAGELRGVAAELREAIKKVRTLQEVSSEL